MRPLAKLILLSIVAFIFAPALKANASVVIYDDFSQPNYDSGSHTPYDVYGTDMWDGAPGGTGLPPNNGTTPGNTVLGTDLPGGVWQLGGGAGDDYDSQEVGNLAGDGASSTTLTGGSTDVPYATLHNNENVGISLNGYNSNALLTVSVNVCPKSNDCYVGFDSALNVANNFTGLRVDQSGGVSLFVNGSQVGSEIAFTGTWVQTTASLLTFTVNTSTGAISNISLQGSTSTYSFTTTAFTTSATSYAALYTPSGGYAYFAYLQISSSSAGAGSAPSVPTGLTATPGNGQVVLNWTASTGATSYNVYRGTAPNGESATALATDVTLTSYTDNGLTNGTTYYYKVTATNTTGPSGNSNEASATPAVGTGTPAVSANAFLNSIGVCTHMTQGLDNESNVATCLTYAGFRNVRDDGSTSSSSLQNFTSLYAATGARVSLLPITGNIAGSLSEYETVAAAGALLAAEGPNEPNNEPVTYDGATSSSTTALPTAEFQRDLYSAVKADSKLAGIPVFDSSESGGSEPNNVGLQFLTIPSGSGVTLMPIGTVYADYANTHNYVCGTAGNPPGSNQAWNAEDPTLNSSWDGLYVEYGHTWWSPGYNGYTDAQLPTVPRVTTETGWVTQGTNAISEDQQGKLFLNLYLTAFKRGWSNTFVYYLHDTSAQGYWGFFHTDYSTKLSGTYLHNMTTILADNTTFAPGSVNYSIPAEPTTVHDLLIENSHGTFYLAVWDDRPVGAGTDSVTVNLGATYPTVNVYDPTVGTSATQTLSNVSSVTLSLSDHPEIIGIPPPPSVPASQTITFPTIGNQVYGATFTLNATASSGLPITYTHMAGVEINGTTATITATGAEAIAASQPGDADYAPATRVRQTFTASPAAQTITFPAIATKTYGTAPVTLSATATSGLAVTYSIVSGSATVSGRKVTVNGAGTIVVAADQVGNTDYAAAPEVTMNITVKPAAQTITFPPIANQTLGATFTLNATASSGLPITYTHISGVKITGTTATTTAVGTVTIGASQAGNTNYAAASEVRQTFTVNPAP